ncbi:MAG: hypothetical protein PHV61_05725 [Limnochordia bacterium]|nr:hypothetical protein [Limnochordia bacterium]MDD2629652.1 hypothetical protein [Limnochordia bacterium]
MFIDYFQDSALCRILELFLIVVVLTTGCPAMAKTLFQTGINTYDPRIDLRTDGVMVHKHGLITPPVSYTLRDWKSIGNYLVYRMWLIGSDAGQSFTRGEYDGHEYPEAIETGRVGNHFAVGSRPYMVPTTAWNEYMRRITRESIDAGVVGVVPEEPLAHAAAGYSPAFQLAWEDFYGEPWQPPHSSRDAFWKKSKLQSHLYLETVKAVIDEAKTCSNGETEVLLPTHSLISHAAGQMIFPSGAAARLPGLDGIIGQVWTGPISWSLGVYAGNRLTRDNGFFDSAWLLYSYFANLTRDSEKQMFLLGDPVEDDPQYRWEQYHLWYNQTLVAMLMFSDVFGYQVMPWPERVFLPGYGTGGGSPGPAEYRTQLMVNFQALSDMENQEEIHWQGGTEGIGVLVGDTMVWQRGGPEGSGMESFHGLVLPLLRQGIPVQVLPVERIIDQGYLDPFRLLLVSYDMWKPLDPASHVALRQWVQQGGILVFFDGNDAYNQVDEWWRQAGYHAPVEHLFEQLGIPVERQSRASVKPQESMGWQEVLRSEADYHNLENMKTYSIDLAPFLPADQILVRLEDGSKQDGWGPFLESVTLDYETTDGTKQSISFKANGGPEEAKYLVEVISPGGVNPGRRFADATGSFTYAFPVSNVKSGKLEMRVGNNFVIKVQTEQQENVLVGTGGMPSSLLTTLDSLLVGQEVPVTSYAFDGENSSTYQRQVGQGYFVYIGVPSALFARTMDGANFICLLSSYAVEQLGGGEYREEGTMVLRRGSYWIAHALTGEHRLTGQFVDLLDPCLSVASEFVLSEGESALLYDVTDLLEGVTPRVLYGSRELLKTETTGEQTYVVSAGPWQTPGVVRLYAGNRKPEKVTAYAMRGFGRRLEAEEIEDLSPWIAKLEAGEMQQTSAKWAWDEASRTFHIEFEQWHSGVLIVVDWEY